MEIKEKHFWYMIFILVLLVPTMVNLKVATSTPIIFGDEGYFASRGEWILENLEIPKYTTDVYSENNLFHNFDLELQEIVFLVSSFFVLGGESMVKALDPISALLAGIMVFLLARKLYSGKIGVLSVFFFLILPCITTYAVFLYGDMLFTLFMVSSMYFLLRSVKENSDKYLFISGIMGGFAIFTKETGFLIFLIYLITFIFYRKNWLKKFIILLLLSSVIAIPWYGLHNFVLLGNPGIPVIEDFFPKDYLSPEIKIMNQTQRHVTVFYALHNYS